jgi:hypothetical protein
MVNSYVTLLITQHEHPQPLPAAAARSCFSDHVQCLLAAVEWLIVVRCNNSTAVQVL